MALLETPRRVANRGPVILLAESLAENAPRMDLLDRLRVCGSGQRAGRWLRACAESAGVRRSALGQAQAGRSGDLVPPDPKGTTCRMGSVWPLAETPGRALHTPGSAIARCLETGEGFCLADGIPGRHADRGIARSSGDPLGCPRSIEAPGSRFSIRMRWGYGHAPSASGNWR